MNNLRISHIYKDTNGNTTVCAILTAPEAWRTATDLKINGRRPRLSPMRIYIQTNGNLPASHGTYLAKGRFLENWSMLEKEILVFEIRQHITEHGTPTQKARISEVQGTDTP